MNSILSILAVAFDEGLFYACLGLGVWITFRILKFPDLSVEGVFPLGAVVSGVLILNGINPFLVIFISILVGSIAGLFTALLNTKLGINNLLSGILTMTGLYSINLAILHGSNLPLLHTITLLNYSAKLTGISNNYYISVIVSGLIVLIVSLMLYKFLHTKLGLYLQATGQNSQMVRSLGVNPDYIKWVGLALSNGLIALSGSLVAQRQGFADVGMGIGTFVIGLAAIILGEQLIRKRNIGWSIIAVVLGTIVYRIIISLALRAGVGPSNLKLVTIVIVIIALVLPRLRKSKNKQINSASYDEEDPFSTFNR